MNLGAENGCWHKMTWRFVTSLLQRFEIHCCRCCQVGGENKKPKELDLGLGTRQWHSRCCGEEKVVDHQKILCVCGAMRILLFGSPPAPVVLCLWSGRGCVAAWLAEAIALLRTVFN